MTQCGGQDAVAVPTVEKKKVFCGVCESSCGLEATIESGELISLRPDDELPVHWLGACCEGQ